NNELQYYTDRTDNIRVEDGHLVITPLNENSFKYNDSFYQLINKFAWKYGRVEVRAKSPNGYGLWPAIWMMPRDSVYGDWPESGEIDIMEARGQELHQFGSTIHYGIVHGIHYLETSGDVQLQCSIDQYHVYTLDWTPTELVKRVSGLKIVTKSELITGQPFDQYFYMILNVAVGGTYLDDPTPSTVWNYPDAEMWVDYVRVYSVE
uniref:GH16 domain-containing protein n=1 Tax=Ciona intestinalis TaxID=7719 RepID=F6UAD5_CIOIN